MKTCLPLSSQKLSQMDSMVINDAAFYRHSKHLSLKKKLTGRVPKE